MGIESPDTADRMAPNCKITFGKGAGTLSNNLVKLIRTIEYESTDNIADMAKITFSNPGFVISDVKHLQPGNEISIWMGYGLTGMQHIGRVEIVRHHPTYPRDGMPVIEVIGYTADRRMMDHSPQKSKASAAYEAANAEEKKKLGQKPEDRGRIHEGKSYSDVASEMARAYGFEEDIDTTYIHPDGFIQKIGMSDYNFIQGMANISGFFFWVDGADDGTWTLHFKKPGKVGPDQDKVYNFKYGQGDLSSLFEFHPELLTHGHATAVKAQYLDKNNKLITAEFPSKAEKSSPEVHVDPYKNYDNSIESLSDWVFDEEHTSAGAIKVFINDFAFTAFRPRGLNSPEALESWVRQWFAKQRENFIMADGVVVGFEPLRARQTHKLSGLRGGLDGLYYFARVRHSLGNNGYETEFDCRKVIDDNRDL